MNTIYNQLITAKRLAIIHKCKVTIKIYKNGHFFQLFMNKMLIA